MKNDFIPSYRRLERRKGTFFRIGLVCSLFVTFAAFEYTTSSRKTIEKPIDTWDNVGEEMLPFVTSHHIITLPEKPVIETKKINPNLVPDIVPDDRDVLPKETDSVTTVVVPVTVKVEVDTLEPDFWLLPEVLPEFKGGENDLQDYLSRNTRYPDKARSANIEGTVYMSFVISEKGVPEQIECLRSPSDLLTNEALRVINNMPPWKPGKQGGKAVRVKMTLPFSFRLLK
jgi:periplasmic protein TonB